MNITNESNMELMSRYEDNHFDLAIVDPPYGIGNFTKEGSKRKNKPNKKWDINWNNSIPNKEYFDEVKRVSKNHIIFGFQYYIKYLWDDLQNVIIHDFGSTGGWGSDADLAITNINSKQKCKVASFKYRWQGFIRGNVNPTDKERIHPCEKPVSLYEWILMDYAKEGDKILDTHLGSGSIAIACHNLKYDLTACELDEEYYNSAIERLERHKQQLTMF
jgi:site-specific DNA-methyltransferase (adenine-specific)